MKIIITESQSQFLRFSRRLNTPEVLRHMEDIIIEGFDFASPCEWVDSKTYVYDIMEDAARTLVFNYLDNIQYGEELEIWIKYISDVMTPKYSKSIIKYYDNLKEDC